jgi:raffinose/stachyose/melibiose transport system permease protein
VNENTAGKKVLSLVLLAAGIAGLAAGLIMAFSGNKLPVRGALLILGAVAILAGLYFFPTLEHHRSIINFLFCFPLLFAFAVTVIIPLCLGIFYSTSDWNGVKMTAEVGLANYAAMFREPGFLWSVIITFLFVIFNMVLVNVIGFCLALLCTSRLKGVGFFRAAYFLPNLIGGIVLGYVWQFVFNNVLLSMTSAVFNMRNSVLAATPTAFAAIRI